MNLKLEQLRANTRRHFFKQYFKKSYCKTVWICGMLWACITKW